MNREMRIECQLKNVDRMMELQNHHLVIIVVIIHSRDISGYQNSATAE